MYRQNWQAESACANLTFEQADKIFFLGPGGSPKRARLFCATCPVLASCRDYAILYDERGIWGGMTREERDIIAIWVRPMLEEQARLAGLLEVTHDPTAPSAAYEDPTEFLLTPDDELDSGLSTFLLTAD